MSGNIVEDVELSFKELEQKVFRYVCMLGCEITQKVLEDYDVLKRPRAWRMISLLCGREKV